LQHDILLKFALNVQGSIQSGARKHSENSVLRPYAWEALMKNKQIVLQKLYVVLKIWIRIMAINSSAVDPDSMGSLESYPDPGGQKIPTNIENI
jgi:hypothetical protein